MARFLQRVLLAAVLVAAALAISLEDLDNIVNNNPEQLCRMTECMGPYSSDECPHGSRWVEGIFMGGCCGGCVRFQLEEEDCTGKIDTHCCKNFQDEVYADYGTCDAPTADMVCSGSPARSSSGGKRSMMSTAALAGTYESIRRLRRSLDRSSDLESVSNVLSSSWCDYGMYCGNSTCVLEIDWIPCDYVRDAYDRDLNATDGYVFYRDDYRYRPQCDTDELKFAPKQCKSSSFENTKVCVCVSEQGETIGGKAFSFQGDLYDDMNCLCSRRKYELIQSGDITTTLHCQTNGNYEELQCEDGWCYCVHTNNGTLYGYQMPEPAMDILPCFNRTLVGDQYLRQCESREHAHNVFVKTMTEKGILVAPSAPVTCGLDGAYASRHCDGSSCSCFSKYNADCLLEGTDGCECMADKLVYDEYGKSYTGLKCEGLTGNYSEVQELLGQQAIYRVDSDGIRTSSVVAEACDDNLYPSNFSGCQVLGNVKMTDTADLTYCESGCLLSQDKSCSPSMYMFNVAEYSPGTVCV